MKKNIHGYGILFLILITAAALFAGCSRGKNSKVIIKGSTTVLPITQKASEAYRAVKKTSISIDGSGSGNGIKALIDGNCDIANSSREIKKEEAESAKSKGINVKEIVAGYDMVVPVVHPSNKVKNISLDQLKGIFDGNITNWKQVGGADSPIVVISRDTSSGTYEIWHEKVLKKADLRKDALLQASNGAIISSIAANPKAIGYVGFGYINSTIKAVTVNNVDISIENGKSGKFPVSRKLYMYVNADKFSPEASDFVNYIISAEGQKLVKAAGFIPIN